MAIYLDNSATTPIDPKVLEAMLPYFKENYANPSSIHTMGREIREHLEKARETVASTINADSNEIIFAGSGTEADNLAILGIAKAFRNKGNHIITSSIEHKAVLESCKTLEKEGFEVTYLKVDSNGLINLDELKNSIKDNTILISIMLANNEIGTIQPIKQIAEIAREKDIIVHTDAVQAVGKMKVDASELGVNLLTFSGHKIYAPKGIAVLYIENNLKDRITPMIYGGAQEFGIRPGTENVPYIIGIAKACEIINKQLEQDIIKIKKLRDLFEEKVAFNDENIVVNASDVDRVCSISNITFKYIEGEALMVYASEVCCSTGSACTADSIDASHVLYAIGVSPVDAHGSLRFSFGRFNTEEEVIKAAEIVKSSAEKLIAMSPLTNK
jgi:cysteine desulfurase